MNNKLFLLLLATTLLVSSVFWSSCVGNKQTNGSGKACKQAATIRDFTGLDGCKFLFELENGDLLLPGEWKTEQAEGLAEGQAVRISYEVMDDMASICMRENHIVRITCFERLQE